MVGQLLNKRTQHPAGQCAIFPVLVAPIVMKRHHSNHSRTRPHNTHVPIPSGWENRQCLDVRFRKQVSQVHVEAVRLCRRELF